MAVQKEGDGSVDDYLDDPIPHPSSSHQSNIGGSSHQSNIGGILSSIADKDVSSSIADRDVSSSIANEEALCKTDLPMLQKGVDTKPVGKEKQRRCNTCDSEVGDATQHREHFKSEWHKHNLKRKVKQLPPVSSEEWELDTEIQDNVNDLNDYSR